MKLKFFVVVVGIIITNIAWSVPEIKGTPVIIKPKELLDWPQDTAQTTPYLTEPTANVLNDFHGVIGECDLVLSTAGNYHMALKDLWRNEYLPKYAKDLDLKNWFYTTSPPISPEQVVSDSVQFGNLNANCRPQVAVGPKGVMNKLYALGAAVQDSAEPVIKNQGNVILIRKGNPKHIKSIWDLGRSDVTLVTPSPTMEPGSFGNFSGSIYNIAAADTNPPEDMDADELFDRIFNWNAGGRGDDDYDDDEHHHAKWVAGSRIMHREQPFMIANGYADAGVIFYHQALYISRTFPEVFDFVPLGGTKNHPDPLPGNKVGTMFAVRILGDWNMKQIEATEALMKAFHSQAFSRILKKYGLVRP